MRAPDVFELLNLSGSNTVDDTFAALNGLQGFSHETLPDPRGGYQYVCDRDRAGSDEQPGKRTEMVNVWLGQGMVELFQRTTLDFPDVRGNVVGELQTLRTVFRNFPGHTYGSECAQTYIGIPVTASRSRWPVISKINMQAGRRIENLTPGQLDYLEIASTQFVRAAAVVHDLRDGNPLHDAMQRHGIPMRAA